MRERRWGDKMVYLLARGVPNLQLHGLPLDLDSSDFEVNAFLCVRQKPHNGGETSEM
jgi:hypothetical protein